MTDAEVMLRSLVSLAAIDGHIDDTEFHALVRLCLEWRLPTSLLNSDSSRISLIQPIPF